MSRRRYISTLISVDKVINRVAMDSGDFAALFYTWMIPHAEDSARIDASPDELLWMVMPGRRDKCPDDVVDVLSCLHDAGLIAWDSEANVVYFESESFYGYQTYIQQKNRVHNSDTFELLHEKPLQNPPAQNAAKRRKTPQNAEERRKTPQNAASLSLSPSLSEEKEQDLLPTDDSAGDPDGQPICGELVHLDDGFEAFWTAYPRKEAKARARKSWRRLTKSERILATGVAEVMGQLVDHGQQDRQFVPHGTTFLNGKRWEDWRDGIPVGWRDTSQDRYEHQQASIARGIALAFGEGSC